jgi:hypothetical protein
MVYGDLYGWRQQKNKAKQSQFQNSAPKGSAGKKMAEKTKNANFGPNLTNFGTEIVISGSIRRIRLKIALKIYLERPVFKGFTFFSFLILVPGEDYNLCFRSWSAQVKRQELFSAAEEVSGASSRFRSFYSV